MRRRCLERARDAAARRAAAAGADGDGGGRRASAPSSAAWGERSLWRRAAARRAARQCGCGSGSGLNDVGAGRGAQRRRRRCRRVVSLPIDGSTHVRCLQPLGADRCLAAATGTGAGSDAVLLWSLARAAPLPPLRTPCGVGCLGALHGQLVCGGADGTITMWDVAASAEVVGSQHHRTATLEPAVDAVGAEVTCLQTLEAAGLIASVSAATPATVHIWDPRGPQQLARTIGGGGGGFGRGAASGGSAVTCLAATRDTLLVGGADGGVLANVRTAGSAPLTAIPPAASGGGGGGVRALACARPPSRSPPPQPTARCRCGAPSARGRRARASASRGFGRRRRRLPRRRRAARRLAAVCGCADGTVAAWRLGALCAAPPPAETRSEWAWDLDVELHR